VVLSDGQDNDSRLTLSQLLSRLEANDTVVDVVALQPDAAQLSILRRITDTHSGAVVAAASAGKLLEAFAQVVVTPSATPTQSPKPTHGSTVSPTSSTSVGDLNQSFAGRLGVLFGLALALALIVTISAVWRFFRLRKLRKRLDQYTDFTIVPAEMSSEIKPTSMLDNFDLHQRMPKTVARLENSALGIPVNIWVMMMALAWFSVLAVFRNSTGSTFIAFIVSTLLVTQGGRLFLQWRFNRRLREFEDNLPATLAVLASSLRAGLSFAQALDTAIADGKGEISLQFRLALQEVQVGSALEDALMRTAERMKSEDLKWAVTGLTIQREVGGSLSRILDTSAKTIRDRAELRREVRTLSAEGRLSAMVLAGLPVLIFLFLMVTRPQYVSVFWTEPIGNVMLAVMLLLFGAGWMWVTKLVKVRV
jgi:tight adherence protein B